MRTHFSDAQRADPDLASSEQILRRCVHCGFCTATCPTYMLLGDELDSPRGRIYLIKEMLESDQAPAPQTVKHIDRCLSCLSCVTTCPSGVDYMHLIDHAREHIERRFARPFGERITRRLLGTVLSRRVLLRAALAAARILRPALARLPRPVQALLPPTGVALLALAPASAAPRGAAERRSVFVPAGPRRGRVALLGGCAQPVLAPSIDDAAIRLLTRHGIEVVIPRGGGCCGALNHHLGQSARARELARANIRAWDREIDGEGLDAILMTTSGCGTMVKDYGHLLRNDPKCSAQATRVSSLARDISEYVHALGLIPTHTGTPEMRAASALPLRVAYQSPCSMFHGQQIRDLPARLLADAGFTLLPLPEAHVCCGSAGTYNVLQPEIAARLRARKQALIAAVQPQVVATGNIGCMMQLSQDFPIPIVHSIELLDWATGGPKPARLNALP